MRKSILGIAAAWAPAFGTTALRSEGQYRARRRQLSPRRSGRRPILISVSLPQLKPRHRPGLFCAKENRAKIRFGSTTVLAAPKRHFRSTPNNGHRETASACLKRANFGSRPVSSITAGSLILGDRKVAFLHWGDLLYLAPDPLPIRIL
jgi:hypothetical protein